MISAAELKVRVAIEGIPQGNAKLTQFEGNLKRVSGYDATATLSADVDRSGFTAFEGELKAVSGATAKATLEADLQGRGFDEFDARTATARARTARPITQTVRAEVDDGSFSSTMARVRALKSKVDRESGGGGLTHSAAGIVMPFGALPTAAAVASPELLALAGAATAVAGSAGEAALGVGALVGGAYGAGAVGIAGIAAVAVPAIASLKAVSKAQTAYTLAVREYGKESTQAETAAKKLRIAEAQAGPEAVKLAGSLRHVKTEWEKLSAPGRNEFLGALADGIDHLEGKLPVLAKSANRSTTAMRHDFDSFLGQTTGKGSGFDHFIGSMTDLFVQEGPMITHTLGDWAKIFENIAEAAGPSLEMVTGQLEHWSNGIEKSTEDAPKLRGEISGLVGQTESWVHFLGQGTDLITTIFGAGAGEGQSLVEDATAKVEDWRTAIEGDPSGTESFFAESGEEAKELTTILAGLIGTWYQEAKAIQPIADEALHIVDALNSLKIGNVSALTVLLGTGFAVGSAAKLIKTIELLKGYGAITGLLRAEEVEQDAVAASQGAAVGSADALAAANDRLTASIEGVTAAQGDLAATQGVGQLSMLETGGVGAAEQAGQMSMFPMGGGVMPAAAESAAPVAMEEAAGGSALAGLGPVLAMGAGGLIVGQVVKEVGDSDLADKVGTAIQGAGVGAAIGTAIAPGIGTAIGAALGGAGGLIIEAIGDHPSDLEEIGAKQAEDFIRGYSKERPKLEAEIAKGFLGHAGKAPESIANPTTGGAIAVGGTKGTGLRGRRQELQEQIHNDANPAATKVFERELALVEKTIQSTLQARTKARTAFAQTIHGMQGDVSLGMGAIDHDLAAGLSQADVAWGHGTKGWRPHAEEAMQGAVHAIQAGVEDGEINAEKGQKRISELLSKIHLIKSNDPFGLAKATADSFEKAEGPWSTGIRKWEKELDLMKPAAAKSAIDSTNKLLEGWAEGHPKIEAQIKSLTNFEVTHFGATNKQLREGVQKGATGPVAEAFAEAAHGVGGALDNIGTNMNAVLKALGAKDFVNFQAIVFGPSRMAGTQLNSEGGGSHAAGEAMHHRAEGGIIPGVASGDVHYTHVRPNTFILNKRATAAYGFNEGGMVPVALEPGERRFSPEEVGQIGLGNLMAMNASVPRFAEGGHINVAGPRATGSAGHAALTLAAHAANAYITAHTPKPKTGGLYHGKLPAGVGEFDGVPVDEWIIPILKWATAHGWTGTVGSGFRTLQEGQELWAARASNPNPVAYPGSSNHEKSSYPGGAVDVSGEGALAAVLRNYPKRPTLVWGPEGGNDDPVHYSATGHQQGGLVQAFANGGVVGFAKGGIPGKPGDRTSAFGKEFQGRLQDIWAVAAPFYGHPGHSMPRTWSAGATGGRAHTASFEDGSRASYLGKPFADEIMLQQPQGEETLIHEWAHYFQPELNKRLRDGHSWEIEGGAEAFARWAAPQIYGAAGLKYHNPGKVGYPGRVAKVVKDKGMPWVEHGQFEPQKFAAGGLVGGGAPMKLAAGGFTGSGYTVKGAPASASQMHVAGEIGKANDATHAPYEAQVAIFMAATQENDMTGTNTFEVTSASGSGNRNDSTYEQALRWQTEGYYDGPKLGAGGGIAKSKKSSDPGLVAQEVEGSAYPTAYEQWKGEGQKWASGWSGKANETKAEETAHTFKETVKKTYHGVRTDPLSLGTSTPSSIEAIVHEVGRREAEVGRYESAIRIAQKENKPGYVQKLQANVTALEKRIRELGRALRALRTKAAEAKVKTRLGKQLTRLTGLEPGIEKAQHHYNAVSEFAGKLVDLEPTIGEEGGQGVDLATYARYVNGQETPAYEQVLAAEADWRNLILAAERRAAGDWDKGKPHVGGMEGRWEGQIEGIVAHETYLEHNEQSMEAFVRQVDAEIQKYRSEHPKADLTDYLKGRRSTREDITQNRLPAARAEGAKLSSAEKETRKSLGEGRTLFYPGGATIREPTPPNPGTGTFEGYLEEVQGIHWPGLHDRADGLPHKAEAASYGGAIFETQQTIEGLGLEIADAIASGTAGLGGVGEGEGTEVGGETTQQSELTALEKEELLHFRQREAVGNALGPVLSQFEQSYPLPYMGAYADGGVALVGERGPELAHFPSGTRVHSAPDTQAMLGRGDLKVVVNGHINQAPGDTRDPVEVLEKHPRAAAWVNRVRDSKQRPVVTTGAPRAWRS